MDKFPLLKKSFLSQKRIKGSNLKSLPSFKVQKLRKGKTQFFNEKIIPKINEKMQEIPWSLTN